MTTGAIQCPRCGAMMRRVERRGIVIDHCGGCGGIFLDRGELQALLQAETQYADPDFDEDIDDPGQKRVSRRGFLEELFDFS